MMSFENYQMLKAKISDDSSSSLTLIDANGHLVNWTASWPAPAVDLTDRAYFKTLKASTDPDQEVVEPVLSHMTGRWKVLFARRLSGPTGQFSAW